MVGIITHDDLMDVVVQEATEDVHRMGAVGPMHENYLEARFVTVWWTRAFWLACLFIGGIFTILALAQFHQAIETVVALSFFIPLCISTGGNSGSQAATLITRALALGQISSGDWSRILRHEFLMGLALGAALGVLGFVSAFVTNHVLQPQPPVNPLLLGLVVGKAVIAICLWGTLVGSMLPLVFKRLGIDPAIASSPFVATLVDVTGILIYFSIATVWLPWLPLNPS
jgi:magnesium transporter